MNSTNTTIACVLEQNPDISGIGIRVSLYVLALIAPFVSALVRSSELAKSVDSSVGLTGLALYLTAIINSARGAMSLYQALCLFHLLCLVGISVSPKAKYKVSMVRMWVTVVLYFLVMLAFVSSAIYVFATAPTYGFQPECNGSVIYVIFGANIPATSPVFRWIFVACLTGVLLSLVVAGLLMTGFFFCMRWMFRHSTVGAADLPKTLQTHTKKEDRGLPWQLVGRLGGSAYIIAMLELIIQRNEKRSTDNPWTFGQVLAMMMLVGPLLDFASFLMADRERERRDTVGSGLEDTAEAAKRRAEDQIEN